MVIPICLFFFPDISQTDLSQYKNLTVFLAPGVVRIRMYLPFYAYRICPKSKESQVIRSKESVKKEVK